MRIGIIGAGRAGSSFALALSRAGHRVQVVHHDELERLESADLVLVTVPDDAIASVAARLALDESRVIAHVAGSRSLDELAPHPRTALLHPLVPLPSGEVGAGRLVGATYSVAGDELVVDVVTSLRGRVLRLSDEQRTAYHATASVAANHLVALMGQVERLASSVGLELDDFLRLAQLALEDVAELGPDAALTGPASRGDMATIDAHLAAIAERERPAYVALANAAFELAEQRRSHTPA